MKQLTPPEALYRLAAYCSKAERCIQDIRQKLTNWEIAKQDQLPIINRLQQEGFLDEQRFCRSFVNDKSKFNKWGSYKISYELKKRNIPDILIKSALSEINAEDQSVRLRQLLQTKTKTVKGKNEYEIRQKLIRFAAGRGFSLDEIEKILGEGTEQ